MVEILHTMEVDVADVVELAIALGKDGGLNIKIYTICDLIIRYIANLITRRCHLSLGTEDSKQQRHNGDKNYLRISHLLLTFVCH